MLTEQPHVVGIALDDCSALEVVDDKYRILLSKASAKARRMCVKADSIVEETIPVSNKYKDLDDLLVVS